MHSDEKGTKKGEVIRVSVMRALKERARYASRANFPQASVWGYKLKSTVAGGNRTYTWTDIPSSWSWSEGWKKRWRSSVGGEGGKVSSHNEAIHYSFQSITLLFLCFITIPSPAI